MTIVDWDARIRDELRHMSEQGITSYKVYLAYNGMRISDAVAYQVIKAVGQEGGIVGCHCENGDLIDQSIAELKAAGKLSPASHPLAHSAILEAEAVNRWLALAEQAGYPVNVVHLSTQRGLEAALLARSHGQALYLESCPQYFTITDEKYHLPGFESAKFIFSPPLRKQEDIDALWEALGEDEIDTIGTDHCSFNYGTTKQLGQGDFSAVPPGIPGVEHRPCLMYTYGVKGDHINLLQMMMALSERPARLFGMFPQKGTLAVGSDADIVIFDPDYTWCISADAQYQNVDYTPYEGMEMSGRTDTVLLNGQIAVEHGKVVKEGLGQFVHRGPAQFWR